MDHPCKTVVALDRERLTGTDETFGFTAVGGTGAGSSGGGLSAGTDLGGVTLLRLLGSGGMGQVYEARQHAPPRKVAVKVVRREAADFSRRRLEDEAALLGQLDHPHIARVYTVGRQTVAGDDCPWLMMELIEGGLSVTAWARSGGLGVASRVALMQDAAMALAAAHAKGVLHLDVKPSNILIDQQGSLKLIDFGIEEAKPTRELLRELVALVEPQAAKFNALDALGHVYTMVERGASADQQLAVWRESDENLPAVVEHLVRETEKIA